MSTGSAWPEVTIKDVCSAVQYGYTASASSDAPGPHFLRITDIVPGFVEWPTVPRCEISASDHRKFKLSDGDIVVARTGATVGYGKLLRNPPDAVFASYLVRFRVRADVDARFVGAIVESAAYKAWVKGQAGGAAQPNANAQVLSAFPLRLPPLPMQRRIASILGAYDDLIEVNRRRIAVQEEMAQRLFEEWFVHFRFPGHETLKSPVAGGLPNGWAASTLADASALISRGIAPTYDDASAVLVIGQKCIRDKRLSLGPARRQRKPVPAEKLVRVGDVLINSTGVGTLGRVAQVEDAPAGTTVDSHVTIVRPTADVDRDYFGLAVLRLEDMFERMGAGATGQTELSRTRVAEVEVPLPPIQLQEEFGRHVRPLRALAHTLGRQNERLSASRDLLLPRLISGDLPVTTAERELEAVA